MAVDPDKLWRPGEMAQVDQLIRDTTGGPVLRDKGTIHCAAEGCRSSTGRTIRLVDSLPVPGAAGWREIEALVPIAGTDMAFRSVAFACSARCEQAVRGGHIKTAHRTGGGQ